MAMLFYFSARTKITVEFFFPVRRHSCLPTDRAFGRVEKILKKHENMVFPSEYFEVFQTVGEVRQYSAHWSVYDFKAFARDVLKTKQTFLISNQHRIEISRRVFKVSTNFSDFYEQFSILERGKHLKSFSAPDLTCVPKNRMKPAKKRDVLRLLSLMGVNESHPLTTYTGNPAHLIYPMKKSRRRVWEQKANKHPFV